MSPGEEMDENTIEALQEVLQDMAKTIELISSGARSGEALISFLEEMLKTIEAWAAKYNVTLDGKTMAMEPTGNPDSYSNPDASPSPSPSPNANHDRNLNPYDNANPYPYTYLDPKPEPNPDPNLANANASQMMDQLELALDLDQDVNVNVNELMDLANERLGENQREGEALPQSAHSLNEEADGLPSNDRKERGNQNETAQLQLGEERQGPSPQTEQGISFPDNRADTASQPSELPMVESSKHVRTTELQDCGLDVVHLVAAGATPSNPHVDHSPMDVNMASTDNADVKMASPNHVPKSLKLEVATPVNDKVVASHASERRGEVIESPAWLPEGWITEMKTRGNGSKAGSKDKYYFDPASKCRCQSRREVFAFLESGKHDRCKGRTKSEPMRKVDGIEDQSAGQANDAGQAKNKRNRYKGRPKTESVRKLVGTEDRSAGQAKDAGQAKSTPETSGIAVSSKLEQQTVPIPPSNNKTSGPPTVPTIAASTGLANSSMLMPHQPGQPSEWLVYESLASLPFPMFEHLRFVENTNKGNSNSSPPSPWPWLFGTSEGLKRPFVDNKPEDSKPVEKSKEGKNVPVTSAGEEARAAEVVPKRPKKVARKNAS